MRHKKESAEIVRGGLRVRSRITAIQWYRHAGYDLDVDVYYDILDAAGNFNGTNYDSQWDIGQLYRDEDRPKNAQWIVKLTDDAWVPQFMESQLVHPSFASALETVAKVTAAVRITALLKVRAETST